jgi:hypothetical protein
MAVTAAVVSQHQQLATRTRRESCGHEGDADPHIDGADYGVSFSGVPKSL